MYATRAMLYTERYPKANDLWEDLDRIDRTGKEWKVTYTKEDCKAIVNRMAADNLEEFGGAATGGARGTGGGSGGGRGRTDKTRNLKKCRNQFILLEPFDVVYT